jgi:hypothetical protein
MSKREFPRLQDQRLATSDPHRNRADSKRAEMGSVQAQRSRRLPRHPDASINVRRSLYRGLKKKEAVAPHGGGLAIL